MLLWLQSFPVTEEVAEARVPGHEFHVLGVIERKAILKMLQHRVGFCTAASACDHLPRQKPELMSLLSRFEQRPLKVNTGKDQAAIIRCASLHAPPCLWLKRFCSSTG